MGNNSGNDLKQTSDSESDTLQPPPDSNSPDDNTNSLSDNLNPPDGNLTDSSSYFTWQNSIVIAESIFYITKHLLILYQVFSTNNEVEVIQNRDSRAINVPTPIPIPTPPTLTPFSSPYVFNSEQQYGIAGNAVRFATRPTTGFLVPEGPDTEAISEADECIVCRTNRKNTIFMPCGHSAICIKCSRDYHSREISKHRDQGNLQEGMEPVIVCIICKEVCTEIKRIYLC